MRSLDIENKRKQERIRLTYLGALYAFVFYAALALLIYLYIKLGITVATFGCIVPA